MLVFFIVSIFCIQHLKTLAKDSSVCEKSVNVLLKSATGSDNGPCFDKSVVNTLMENNKFGSTEVNHCTSVIFTIFYVCHGIKDILGCFEITIVENHGSDREFRQDIILPLRIHDGRKSRSEPGTSSSSGYRYIIRKHDRRNSRDPP